MSNDEWKPNLNDSNIDASSIMKSGLRKKKKKKIIHKKKS